MVILSEGKAPQQILTTCTMNMRPLQEIEIDEYLKTGEWRGCVGCYQFENKGGNLFDSVKGNTQSIIGLPSLMSSIMDSVMLQSFRDSSMKYLMA